MSWPLPARADRNHQKWSKKLDDELNFWTTWFQGHGLSESEDYHRRTTPDSPVREHLKLLIDAPEGAQVDVLDVGAGPVSIIGTKWPGREINVTAVDPLADQYNEMLDRLGVVPALRTQSGEAESLLSLFEPESFDFVYSCNALDHSHDPVLGIANMFELMKTGGKVRLEHNANEGENQRYRGLHQWNFDVRDERFVVWKKKTVVFVDEVLPAHAKIKCELCDIPGNDQQRWLNVTIEK